MLLSPVLRDSPVPVGRRQACPRGCPRAVTEAVLGLSLPCYSKHHIFSCSLLCSPFVSRLLAKWRRGLWEDHLHATVEHQTELPSRKLSRLSQLLNDQFLAHYCTTFLHTSHTRFFIPHGDRLYAKTGPRPLPNPSTLGQTRLPTGWSGQREAGRGAQCGLCSSNEVQQQPKCASGQCCSPSRSFTRHVGEKPKRQPVRNGFQAL